MFRLSRKLDYGVLAIRHLLAVPPGEYSSARAIAAEYDVPRALMAKLLQRLARRGLVTSHHGIKGGYRMGRAASEITLRDVLEALEGPWRDECRHRTLRECASDAACGGRRPGRAVQRKIAEVLATTTLVDLAGPRGRIG